MESRFLAVLAIIFAISISEAFSQDSEGGAALPIASKERYEFEHQVLPYWTHNTDGTFLSDLMAGKDERLREVAEDMVSAEFARGIVIQPYSDKQVVLIKFPAPKNPIECYFAYVAKARLGNEFVYFTYEKTFSLGESNVKGIVGSWDKESRHMNHGERTYEDSESFVADVPEIASR